LRPHSTRYCSLCGTEWSPGDFVCPAEGCGAATPSHELPVGVVPPELPGADVAGPLEGLWRLPFGKVSLWHGPPASGKSSLAYLTLPGAEVVSPEQEPGLVARYRQRLGVPQTRTVSPEFDEDGILARLGVEERRPRELIYDSVSVAADDVAVAKHLVDYCAATGARCIAISHETVAGTAWGGNTIPHLVHSRLRVFRESFGSRMVEIAKDRSGPDGRLIPWRLPTDAPPEPKFVSVEGAHGRYRLVEHPGGKAAEWAGPLEAAEAGELELPAPPLAVCAKRSRLYRTGWAEPGDLDDRRAFAESLGFTFFRPTKAPERS
jgi:hypothetical protein